MIKQIGRIVALTLAIVSSIVHAQPTKPTSEQTAEKRLPKECLAAPPNVEAIGRSEAWGGLGALGGTLWASDNDELLAFSWQNCRPHTVMALVTSGQLSWGDSVRGIFYDTYLKKLKTQDYGLAIQPRSIEVTSDGFAVNWGMQRRRCRIGRGAITCTLEIDPRSAPPPYSKIEDRVPNWRPQETRQYRPLSRARAVQLLVKAEQFSFGDSTLTRWSGADRPHLHALGSFNGLRTYTAITDGPGPKTFTFVKSADTLTWITFTTGTGPDRLSEFRKVAGGLMLQPISVAEISYLPSKDVATGPLEITPNGAIVVTTRAGKVHYRTSASGDYALARLMTYDARSGWIEKSRRYYVSYGDYRYGSTAGWGALARLPEGIWRTPAGTEVYRWIGNDRILVIRYTDGGVYRGHCELVVPPTGRVFSCSGGTTSFAFSDVTDSGFVRDGVAYTVAGDRRDVHITALGGMGYLSLERVAFERGRIAAYNREDARIVARNEKLERRYERERANRAPPSWSSPPVANPLFPSGNPNTVTLMDGSTYTWSPEKQAELERFKAAEQVLSSRRGGGGSGATPATRPHAKAYEQLARDRAANSAIDDKNRLERERSEAAEKARQAEYAARERDKTFDPMPNATVIAAERRAAEARDAAGRPSAPAGNGPTSGGLIVRQDDLNAKMQSEARVRERQIAEQAAKDRAALAAIAAKDAADKAAREKADAEALRRSQIACYGRVLTATEMAKRGGATCR